jgi:hypothetical protein
MPLRKLAALEVTEEFIGRATEMGKPILTSTGRFGFQSNWGATAAVGLDMLGYTTRLACDRGAEMVICVGPADTLPVAYEVYRDGCIESGHPEMYKEENVMYFGGMPGSTSYGGYYTGVMGTIASLQPGAALFWGYYWGSQLRFGVVARRVGCMTVGSAAEFDAASFGMIGCDYLLINEEAYAAGAYVSKDPVRSNLLMGEDVMKWYYIISVIIGAILMTAGSTALVDLWAM